MGMDGPRSIINSTSFENQYSLNILILSPYHHHLCTCTILLHLILTWAFTWCYCASDMCYLSLFVVSSAQHTLILVLCFHWAYRHQASCPISRKHTPSTSWSLSTHDNRLKREECKCPFSSSCLCIVLFCNGRHICVYFTLTVFSFSFLIRHISSGIADPIR